MSDDFDHVILTRFNLPSTGYESIVRAQDGWLRSRVALFEKYCLPSVLAQTVTDATWIIYFDPESPSWLTEWIEPHAAAGSFTPVFRDVVTTKDMLQDIEHAIGTPRLGLITTNLDNDDALATDFVERIQAAAPHGQRTAVYAGRGLIADRHGVYTRVDRYNAFCTVAEPWAGAVTCWSDWHNRLPLSMKALTLAGAPGWLQVVHGENVSNRVRGRLARPAAYADLFPGLLDEVPAPSRGALLRDRLVSGPARATRESVRSAAKAATIAVLGPRGLDSVKLHFASGRRRKAAT
ncbi:glycosyltransferase [Leifsonia sp. TF02-11]|uniref:glycosyltransferase n=1 Tax=Leifsonia sp. TF02-11 TaxID=2815212 RepID=UPI001AA18E59|nr:glycosyltransferase [Leifsonia sp. TF02-11]MBO1739146.1 hypothetical protein [Leifsonia sp. TF02-11]